MEELKWLYCCVQIKVAYFQEEGLEQAGCLEESL
jgi:hypothetical protein